MSQGRTTGLRGRRVVVTGVGLVSPLGVGTDVTWERLLAGASGIGPITAFDASALPARIAGEVPAFEPTDFMGKKEARRTDRFVQFAHAASRLALEDSGLSVGPANRDRVGVLIGSGLGGLLTLERNHRRLIESGPGRISPLFIPALAANMAAGGVSIAIGARGPNSATATACSAGVHAIGDAFRLIRLGSADAMIAGGAEAPICELVIAGLAAMKALSTRNEEPERASRPWDEERDGFVLGEGAGIVVLEELEGARSRGAATYAEVVGYGATGDAHHISAPHPEGAGAESVMRRALEEAGLAPAEVGYVNAHGTSTPRGDLVEVRAIERAFSGHARKLAVSSTKSATGHLLGAAGGLEAGVLALAVRDQQLPPTLNLERPGEGCDLDFVPLTARRARVEAALTNSFGFGGTNGALALRRFAD